MFTNGTILSIAASDGNLAGKLLSEAEKSFDSQDQAPAKFEALREFFEKESAAAKVKDSRHITSVTSEACVECA